MEMIIDCDWSVAVQTSVTMYSEKIWFTSNHLWVNLKNGNLRGKDTAGKIWSTEEFV